MEIQMETIQEFIVRMSKGAYKYRKLELLKIVRDKTGLGFKDSKDLIESCTRRK
jgi:ribosomal protein L7/L12